MFAGMHTIPFTSVYFWKRPCADYFEDILPKEAEDAFKLTASGFVLTPEAASYQDIIYQAVPAGTSTSHTFGVLLQQHRCNMSTSVCCMRQCKIRHSKKRRPASSALPVSPYVARALPLDPKQQKWDTKTE